MMNRNSGLRKRIVAGLLAGLAVAATGAPIDSAESVLDAFYSWDAALLESRTTGAGESRAALLYYQAWAEAANYEVALRRPCETTEAGVVECRVTVHDDFGRTLGYTATDTFTFTFDGQQITGVAFEGDDPPVFMELFGWIAETRPEVMAGPCLDLFEGGQTPADCARAVVRAANAFVQLREGEGRSVP